MKTNNAEVSVKTQTLRKIGNGIEYTTRKRGGKLTLVGRRMKRGVSRMVSYTEGQNPNRGKWRDPDTGAWSYPGMQEQTP